MIKVFHCQYLVSLLIQSIFLDIIPQLFNFFFHLLFLILIHIVFNLWILMNFLNSRWWTIIWKVLQTLQIKESGLNYLTIQNLSILVFNLWFMSKFFIFNFNRNLTIVPDFNHQLLLVIVNLLILLQTNLNSPLAFIECSDRFGVLLWKSFEEA